ncbi:UPF0149 family protein [Aliikangiella sp. GXAS 311]|uniref:UPF0149 family protein n=2 Tax=Aliikangiella maris TaxID=3162458 RepID=A0ABV2BYJ6_9GAMM
MLGFITGVCSSPELIYPSDWIPMLAVDEDAEINYDTDEQCEQFMASLMCWSNYCNDCFNKEKAFNLFQPDSFDTVNGASKELKDFALGYLNAYEWLHELWEQAIEDDSENDLVVGFVNLMMIQTASWPKVLQESEQSDIPNILGELLSCKQSVSDILQGAILDAGSIGHKISQQNALSSLPVEQVINQNKNVGRNDPCPCGSGKKFKKCCLH